MEDLASSMQYTGLPNWDKLASNTKIVHLHVLVIQNN
jgi:hypothetical protein